jgi:hypothetical protein
MFSWLCAWRVGKFSVFSPGHKPGDLRFTSRDLPGREFVWFVLVGLGRLKMTNDEWQPKVGLGWTEYDWGGPTGALTIDNKRFTHLRAHL